MAYNKFESSKREDDLTRQLIFEKRLRRLEEAIEEDLEEQRRMNESRSYRRHRSTFDNYNRRSHR